MWTLDLKRQALNAFYNDCRVHWNGVEVQKHPNDLISVAEIIEETKPELIVETGSAKGGSAVFYASLGVDVVSVDKAPPTTPAPHPRVEYLRGPSTSPLNIYRINEAAKERRVMVSLDSDHSASTVRAELDAYAHLVALGCYLIVEDTALGTWITGTAFDRGGPADALAEWLPKHPEFEADEHRERFGPTMHPGGWLKRVSGRYNG